MWGNFYYDKVEFKKHKQGDWLVATGEMTNRSGKNYNAVVFRIILFIGNIPIGNAVITIRSFRNGQTRRFEKQIGELEYSKVVREISRYEIYPESSY